MTEITMGKAVLLATISDVKNYFVWLFKGASAFRLKFASYINDLISS
jgi:hypothetical protein